MAKCNSNNNNSNISSDLINTNIISENELVFSDIYIKENINTAHKKRGSS